MLSYVMYQQCDCTIIIKLTVNTKVPGRKPGVCVQQWLGHLFLKTDHCVLCWGLGRKPKPVDGIQAGLAEFVLNQIPVNIILNTACLECA